MGSLTISESQRIPVPPGVVYDTIRNYDDWHPKILPAQFTAFRVEQGGKGAGTVIWFQMRILGRVSEMRASVTEPEPGRRLVETDLEGNVTTTFHVDSLGGNACQVTISTLLTGRTGLAGWVERRVVGAMLRPIYRKELDLLEQIAIQRANRP